jgi:hypothetical protein
MATIEHHIESSVSEAAEAERVAEPDRNGAEGDRRKKELRFAHPSEEEFAHILDFYQLEWDYEPRTFPLDWDEDGNPSESFTPDFYLPALDLYIELTTLKQSLVTKKNRKLRRLRELYPDINIKLFYGRDFRKLMEKYGLAEPA